MEDSYAIIEEVQAAFVASHQLLKEADNRTHVLIGVEHDKILNTCKELIVAYDAIKKNAC